MQARHIARLNKIRKLAAAYEDNCLRHNISRAFDLWKRTLSLRGKIHEFSISRENRITVTVAIIAVQL